MPTTAEAWRAVVEQFRPDNVRAHQKFLSSDALEGRGTGQRGGEVAIEYIATQFALDGLKPGGDNGTYIQAVPLIGVQTKPSTRVAVVKDGRETPLQWLSEYVGADESLVPESHIDAPMVFVGYGIVAPEYNWDDYKGQDVKGKLLVMMVNDPPSDDPKFFGGKGLTYYGRWTYKFEIAARKGAAGVLLIHTTQSAGYGWDVVRNSWGRENPYVRLAPGEHALKLAAWISEAKAREVFQMAGKDLAQMMAAAGRSDFQPVPLGVTLLADVQSDVREIQTANVIGILEGSDPKLKSEAVVYSAHHDHLGIGEPVKGDAIYNGAVDNASGVALLLEMAHAFTASPVRPRRSIVFAAVAAEEGGLRGSQYYATHPPIAPGKTALNINYDGLQFLGRVKSVNLLGAERTTLEPLVEQAARTLGFHVIPDKHPEQGYYYRSDHFSLAKVGVPSFSLELGDDVEGKPAGWGEQKDVEYRKNHYHQPSDEFDPSWDYSAAKQAAEIGIFIGWHAAMQPQLPGWKKGDEFEAARLKSLGADN